MRFGQRYHAPREDARWTGSEWLLTPIRRRIKQDDPQQLLRTTYRVLLTRGRDGFVVYIPDDRHLDQTEVALLAAGLKPCRRRFRYPCRKQLPAAAPP